MQTQCHHLWGSFPVRRQLALVPLYSPEPYSYIDFRIKITLIIDKEPSLRFPQNRAQIRTWVQIIYVGSDPGSEGWGRKNEKGGEVHRWVCYRMASWEMGAQHPGKPETSSEGQPGLSARGKAAAASTYWLHPCWRQVVPGTEPLHWFCSSNLRGPSRPCSVGGSPRGGTTEARWDAVSFAGHKPVQLWLEAEWPRGEGSGTRATPTEPLEEGPMFFSFWCSWQVLSKCGMTRMPTY